MIETIVTIIAVLGAAFWFFRWFGGAARGKGGCSCGGCSKRDCLSRRHEQQATGSPE